MVSGIAVLLMLAASVVFLATLMEGAHKIIDLFYPPTEER